MCRKNMLYYCKELKTHTRMQEKNKIKNLNRKKKRISSQQLCTDEKEYIIQYKQQKNKIV